VSVDAALLWAGLSTIATTTLALVARLPDKPADLSPWNHWRMPVVVEHGDPELERGPVLVTVEYHVDAQHAEAFVRAMQRYGRVRRRDGASRWGIFHDLERGGVYLETFLVASWAEHLRQHERLTRGDQQLEDAIAGYTRKPPVVRHLIYAEPRRGR
jgi:hypothetical protein